jgi:CSLREA domain-containing protein
MKFNHHTISVVFILWALFASLLAGAVTTTPARAASIVVNSNADTVTNDGSCTLREAIIAANTDVASGALAGECAAGSGADTITFAGDYFITLTASLPNVLSEITISGAGRAITINGNNTHHMLLVFGSTSTLTIDTLTISEMFSNSSGSTGGAIGNSGTLHIINSVFSNNDAETDANGGGAVLNYFGVVTISNSAFTGNTTSKMGGAIQNFYGTVTINSSTFTGNMATETGGAISSNTGQLSLTNSTITNNTAGTFGGGVFNTGIGSSATITNVTFLDNAAGDGGSVYNDSGSFILKNSILAVDIFGMVNCGGSITDGTANIATDTTCNPATPVYFNQLKLGTLGNHGGSTQTIPLLTGSPAIDAGDDATCAAAPVSNTSQNGVSRPSSTHCDIGSFEKAQVFADVPFDGFAWAQIESIYTAGITGGCSTNPLNYCPNNSVTRAQMAVFLLRGIHGSAYSPPAATGTVFTDVPSNAFAAAWIEQMVAESITSGCGNGNYCPNSTVTRAQMAVFLLRAKYGSAYSPPVATGTVFTDVPSNGFAAAFIEQLVSESITSGCGGGNYCPNNSVTRAQMAVFLQRTFNLPLP